MQPFIFVQLSVVLFCLTHAASKTSKSSHPDCPAHFGNQALQKKVGAVLLRPMTLRCQIKGWNPHRCGETRKFVRWFFNGTELLQRQFYPALKLKRMRLNIVMMTHLSEGVYTCMLPNGLNRTFTVTARSDFVPQIRFKDLLPLNISKEQRNRVYWLPEMLAVREQFVSNVRDHNLKLFKCSFYLSSNDTAVPPLVRWTFSHMVLKKLVTLGAADQRRLERRPHVEVRTQKISCDSLVKVSWRQHTPLGSCHTTSLYFYHFHDDELGQYTCHIGGGPISKHQLSMNFTISAQLDTGLWIRQKPRRTEKKSTGMVSLSFNRDRSVCKGRNLTLKCNADPSNVGLVIYKRIPNASEALNYSLQLMAVSKPAEVIRIVHPDAKDANETGPDERRRFPEEGKVELTLRNVSFAASGVYQCSTRDPWSPRSFVQRSMLLRVDDCSLAGLPQRKQQWGGDLPATLAACLVPALAVLVVMAVVTLYCARRLKSASEHRRVVVVHPNVNAAYPAFLPRCASGHNIDSSSCSGGSSCLTPSSTLDSTASLRTPLRPPEVLVQPARRTRRFTRAASLSSGSTRWIRSNSNVTYELPDQLGWELPRQCLRVGVELGEGAFGVVRRGVLSSEDGLVRTRVAVKMLKEDFSEEELTDLVKEIEVMKLLEPHPNIVRLLGVCTRNGPLCLVNEFAPFGNLRDFLRQRRPGPSETAAERLSRINLPRGLLTYRHLIDFGLQVATGLEYLSARSVVHRDIAARNVLVGELFEAKIADFGMSRHVVNYYRKTTEGRLPVKWLAPEALFDYVFTREGDVWSFGILLWEIFSLGSNPYPCIPVERLFGLLRQGYRNDMPFYAFPQVYQMMMHCWNDQPALRPRFPDLRMQLEQMRGVEEYAQILRESPYSELAVSHAYVPMEA